ncbi:MAG: hypothetical protein ACYDH2_03065 [Anaerolineaceae bacterium]
MLKTILLILVILVVFAGAAGGIYLLVENSGTRIFGNAHLEVDFNGEIGTRPEGGDFERGQPPSDGDFKPGGEEGGFSSRGLTELGVSIGKIALITIGVVLLQGLIRFFRRHRKTNKLIEA